MSFSSDSKEQISLKKLLGKAHTKNESEFYNESKSSGISVNANTVFAEDIPASPSSSNQNQITSNIVEYIRLELTPLTESIQDGKYHAFSAGLPSSYQSDTGNSKAGDGNFNNSTSIHSTQGKVQFVSDSAGLDYEVKVYNGGTNSGIDTGSRIPILDNRRWYFDYFNGVLFQQNPKFSSNMQAVTTDLVPGNSYQIKVKGNTTDEQWRSLGIPLSVTPDVGVSFIAASSLPADVTGFGSGEVYPAENPEYVEAFLYVGKMANERFTESNGGDSGNDGADFTFKGRESTKADLDGISSPEKGDAYFVDVDESQANIENVIYVYDGSNFVSGGSLKGDDGDDGAAGAQGDAGEDAPTINSISISGTTITTALSNSTSVAGSIDLSIDDLSNVDITSNAPSGNQVLKWDGSKFIPSDDTGKTQEEIEDIAGGMIGTTTDITVTYNDNEGNPGNISYSVDNTIARLASPTFTGIPAAPTASAGNSTTQISTTAFVQQALSNYQPLDAALTSISGLTTSSNQLIYTTSSDTYAVSTLTEFARGLLDDVDAATMRSTLGLGEAALSDDGDFLSSNSVLDNLSDVSITNIQNAQILVYDNDGGEADDKWKNITVTGDVTIDNAGVTAIGSNKVSNLMIQNSFLDIAVGANTDRLNLGETFTIEGTNNQVEVSGLSDQTGSSAGATLTIGLPDDVTISGDLIVTGDLTINGDSTSIVTTNLDVTDSIISLNNGITGDNPVTRDIGFFLDRGDLNAALIFWDEADDVFKLGTNSGNINSTASDLADANFSYAKINVATAKDVNDNIDLTSSDNTAATTEWVSAKVSAIAINDLSDVNTNGAADGKILKFDSNSQLVVGEQTTFIADTSSMWEIDLNDSNNIFPHGIIDGTLDTGMFAIELSAGDMDFTSNNTTLEDIVNAIQNMNAYTLSNKAQADISDTYWEIDENGDVTPKDAD